MNIHAHLRDSNMTPDIMLDSERNDFYSHFTRLIGLEICMMRRQSGVRVTYASDYRRIAMEFRVLLADFKNAVVQQIKVQDHEGVEMFFVLDTRMQIPSYAAHRRVSTLRDIPSILDGHPCMLTTNSSMLKTISDQVSTADELVGMIEKENLRSFNWNTTTKSSR